MTTADWTITYCNIFTFTVSIVGTITYSNISTLTVPSGCKNGWPPPC